MINLFSFDGAQQLNELLGVIVKFLPNVVLAILTFLIGMIISKIIAKFIKKILTKIKIDTFVESLQKIDFIEKANINISFSNIVSNFVYYFLLLIFLVLATDILGVEMVSNLLVDIFNFIPHLFVALLIIIFGLLLANWLKDFVYTITKSLNVPSAGLLSNLVFYFIFVNVLISAMVQAKINVGFFSTNISLIIGGVVFAFALAYGLASKGVLANIITSFYYKNNYNIGDYIKIDKNEGKVCAKDNFSITLRKDNEEIIIPISKLNESVVVIRK